MGSFGGSERSRNGGIDRVPVAGAAGELWLCGKHLIGPDPEAAAARVGADLVVCLNERHELEDRYPAYVDWLRTDPRVRWVPVPDLGIPPIEVAATLARTVAAELDAGRSVLAHCGAGIGRAGTLAAAVLVVRGASVEEAVAVVAASRPTAGPEAGVQLQLLHDLAGAAPTPTP